MDERKISLSAAIATGFEDGCPWLVCQSLKKFNLTNTISTDIQRYKGTEKCNYYNDKADLKCYFI